MSSLISIMKRWYSGVIFASLFMLLVLRYGVMKNSITESYTINPFSNTTNPLEWVNGTGSAVQNPNTSQVISAEEVVFSLYKKRNLSDDEHRSLETWRHLKNLIKQAHVLPNGVEAIKEAGSAWNSLMASVEVEKSGLANETSRVNAKNKQCPYFLNKMNATLLDGNGHSLQVPCGLTLGSSITIFGIPNGLLGNFRIELTGEPLPGEPDPAIILHYNVRLHGDKITEDPVIVQNTWTVGSDWGEEDRCPNPDSDKNKRVDDLESCNEMVGRDHNRALSTSRQSNSSNKPSIWKNVNTTRRYFPFKQGYPFVATLRAGSEGIRMTVDGKHITSFAYRESLEPWLVNEVRILGDLKLISVVASGLPTSEDLEHIIDIEALISAPLPPKKPLDLLIGVFSNTNNFKQRMAVRRTWMQYAAVKSGKVAVRFFVGLHKNQMVNEELWNEAQTYGDTQLMPFVDYYSIITWKTLAICIYGTEAVSAKYVMKTDDDAFVRVDEILTSMTSINTTGGLLYGLINSDSQPDRNAESKWYTSSEEWTEDVYPPWANGPGYVVSRDIAKEVYNRHQKGSLKMFKLEDVAMGIWIADIQKGGMKVRYEKDDRIFNEGCKDGYVVAHYQSPREIICCGRSSKKRNVLYAAATHEYSF